MEHISKTLGTIYQTTTQRAYKRNIFKKYKAKMPKQPKLHLYKGNCPFPNNILDIIITDPHLEKREIKLLLLIVRLTTGLNQNSCTLCNRDFEAAGIGETHCKAILKDLEKKRWITKTPETKKYTTYKIHKDRILNQTRNPKLAHLIYCLMLDNNQWTTNELRNK